MQQRSRGPPAPFPIAGQVAGPQIAIAIASAACSPAGPETDPPFSRQRWRRSTQFQLNFNTEETHVSEKRQLRRGPPPARNQQALRSVRPGPARYSGSHGSTTEPQPPKQ